MITKRSDDKSRPEEVLVSERKIFRPKTKQVTNGKEAIK